MVATLDANHGLTNDTVYCMLQDAAGLVYLNSNRGVNVVDLSLLGSPGAPAGVPADTGRPAVRALLSADGLASNEWNLGACFRDGAGRLWFGSVAGVSVYDPRRAPPGREPPRVHISGLRLFGGEMPLPLQAKLLRVLQSQEFRRIGDDTDRQVDVRIITATNRDLEQLAARGAGA